MFFVLIKCKFSLKSLIKVFCCCQNRSHCGRKWRCVCSNIFRQQHIFKKLNRLYQVNIFDRQNDLPTEIDLLSLKVFDNQKKKIIYSRQNFIWTKISGIFLIIVKNTRRGLPYLRCLTTLTFKCYFELSLHCI